MLALMSLQGCFSVVPQLSCQTSATQPVVRTLSWKPTWEYADVDINQSGEFYFSPSDRPRGQIPPDVLYQVQLDGTRTEIRLRNDTLEEPAPVLTPEAPLFPRNPGNLAVFGPYVWVSGVTWIKTNGGVAQQTRLIRVQPHNSLSGPDTWRPLGAEENWQNSPIMAVSDSTIYAGGCGITRVSSTPPSQQVLQVSREGLQGYCKPSSFPHFISLAYFTMTPSETFYATPQRPENYSNEAASEPYRDTFYQVYRIKNGQFESWAGSAEKGFKDGERDQARFNEPMDLAAARDGTVYVADRSNHAIRKISPEGTVTTLIGNGQAGSSDGTADTARLDMPLNILLGPCHKLYVFDKNGIREIALPPGPSSERWGSSAS